jgi:predicted ester cyclase
MSTSITELIGSFYEAFSGKTELLDAVMTDDWDDIPLGPGQEPGRAGARSLIEGINKVFSDLRIVVEEIIDARGAGGNGMVGVRAKMRGVHTGEFLGIAPTGRETEVRAHDFHEIVDGRVVRTYHMEDWLNWFQQVQSWPSAAVMSDRLDALVSKLTAEEAELVSAERHPTRLPKDAET